MAAFIILLLLTFTIVTAPWLGADSRQFDRGPDYRPDWPAYPVNGDQQAAARQNR